MQQQLETLNSLCICYDDLKEITNDPGSLEEIKRKQNDRESLTNITDEAYHFFAKLDNRSRQDLTHENLVKYGIHLHTFVQSEIKTESELYEIWLSCFFMSLTLHSPETDNTLIEITNILSAIVTRCENQMEVYKSVIDLFLCVNRSQFRRDHLAYIRQEKGKALRGKKSKKRVKQLDLQFCRDDNSDGKIATHLRLQSELAKNPNYFKETSFTKKVLQVFGKAYSLSLPSKLKKDDMNKLLTQKVLESDKILNPEVFLPSSHVEQQPTTSNQSTSEIIQPVSHEQVNTSEEEQQTLVSESS